MTLKVLIPHPTIKEHHVKHTAALLTLGGGVAAYIPFGPIHILEGVLFAIAGCIAIYEPTIIRTFNVSPDEEEPQEDTI